MVGFQPLNHYKQKCKMFPNNNHAKHTQGVTSSLESIPGVHISGYLSLDLSTSIDLSIYLSDFEPNAFVRSPPWRSACAALSRTRRSARSFHANQCTRTSRFRAFSMLHPLARKWFRSDMDPEWLKPKSAEAFILQPNNRQPSADFAIVVAPHGKVSSHSTVGTSMRFSVTVSVWLKTKSMSVKRFLLSPQVDLSVYLSGYLSN